MEMPPPPPHAAWRIVSGDGGCFRWDPVAAPAISCNGGRSEDCLQSMADLMLEASWRIPEASAGGGNGAQAPMFRTGSGKSVPVKEASIRKARIFIDGLDEPDRGVSSIGNCIVGNDEFPMFRTGSGRSVSVKQSSIKRAAAVLDGDSDMRGVPSSSNDIGKEFPMFRTGSGKSVPVKQSSLKRAAAVLGDIDPRESLKPSKDISQVHRAPTVNTASSKHLDFGARGAGDIGDLMFRMGSCRSLSVKQRSIHNSRAFPEEKGEQYSGVPSVRDGHPEDAGFPMFRTGSGKSVTIKHSSIKKAVAVLEGDDPQRDHPVTATVKRKFPSLPFQTDSGDTLDIASAGLHKVNSQLVVEGCHKNNVPVCFGHTTNMSNGNSAIMRTHAQVPAKWNITSGSTDTLSNGHLVELQTGGRYISVSSDALMRAKSLLGDPESTILCNVRGDKNLLPRFGEEGDCDRNFWRGTISLDCRHKYATADKSLTDSFHASTSSFNTRQSNYLVGNSQKIEPDAVNTKCFVSESVAVPSDFLTSNKKLSSKDLTAATGSHDICRTILNNRQFRQPLADISNIKCVDHAKTNKLMGDNRRPGEISFISPFKKPRVSRFVSPLECISSLHSGLILPPTSCKARVASRYPFECKRKRLAEFFISPPGQDDRLGHLADSIKYVNADNAQTYKFHDVNGGEMGPDAFQKMLLQSGASLLNATYEWVANHYKWIVWKLACLERRYPTKTCGKYLTILNVLEELKYRYDREVNYGHRSAIKRILDGDASSSAMILLCVSCIRSYPDDAISKMETVGDSCEENKITNKAKGSEYSCVGKIELTDGWYSLDAYLDKPLSKQLARGKLFIGQKLRIWGASLYGWVGPVDALEASKPVSLLMHINGTYRAHWADTLGFCNGLGAPLAFRCIKGSGGRIPSTILGLTRVYPVLYKERFPDGGFVVRSEGMEKKALQLYNQRRYKIVQDIMSEPPLRYLADDDSEEGAKIFRILESTAEPELLMADMTSEQLFSFSRYRIKQEEIRESELKRKIEKALNEAGLSERDVTPFIRLRVVGLRRKDSCKKHCNREGLITIWNPSEKQKFDLVEGQIYSVAGLVPYNSDSDVIYLQARGSSMLWKSLPASKIGIFEPFFTPRKPTPLSDLGEVPLSSEFDIAAVVVHVGDVCLLGQQRKQWLFVTDGSICHADLCLEESCECLLAVKFTSSIIDHDSFPLLNQALCGITVVFRNLVKRPRDKINHLWVADATEISSYFVCPNPCNIGYLKEAATSVLKWAKISCLTIQKLRKRILYIVGDH